ncbi:MAG: amine dehydrogenase large subunit [Pseudomonadota bacterium]
MKHFWVASAVCLFPFFGITAQAQSYDSILGDALSIAEPGSHWFAVVGDDQAVLIDGDAGSVEGSLTLSMFSPAIEAHLAKGRIYSYGSFYTRTYYGERTDAVLTFDVSSARPVSEIIIPPKSAGIGHGGMIGLIEDRFVGVWNITPAMSVSVVDTLEDRFVGEISTPGCAGVYPVAAGFLMACGDGRLQFIRLDSAGAEVERLRSDSFFTIDQDPVFDFAVPTATGWMFLTLEGLVYEASVSEGQIFLSEPWSINPKDEPNGTDLNGVPIDPDDAWRIGGKQAFAFNPATGLLVTVMHEGGGQETFEDAGTQLWAFSTVTQRRAYVIDLDEESKARSVELTADQEPLLIVAPEKGDELQIRDGLSGRLLRVVPEISGSALQRLE